MIGDLMIGLGAGALAGAVFFGGLHWTVWRLAAARRPAALAAGSFVVRSAAVVAVFFLMMNGSFFRALAGLAGLVVVRTVIVAGVRRSGDRESVWN